MRSDQKYSARVNICMQKYASSFTSVIVYLLIAFKETVSLLIKTISKLNDLKQRCFLEDSLIISTEPHLDLLRNLNDILGFANNITFWNAIQSFTKFINIYESTFHLHKVKALLKSKSEWQSWNYMKISHAIQNTSFHASFRVQNYTDPAMPFRVQR